MMNPPPTLARVVSVMRFLIATCKNVSVVALGCCLWFVLFSYHPNQVGALLPELRTELTPVLDNFQFKTVTSGELARTQEFREQGFWSKLFGGTHSTLPEPKELKKATAALSSASSAPVPEAFPPVSNASGTGTSTTTNEGFAIVPMSTQPKALFIKANINNVSLGHFVLDTGATYMSISRDMAEELGLDLRHTSKVPITTANGTIEVPKVILKSVKVNGLEARNVEATVMDFKSTSSFSGLLGLSFISRFRLTLDPMKGQMVFEPVASAR